MDKSAQIKLKSVKLFNAILRDRIDFTVLPTWMILALPWMIFSELWVVTSFDQDLMALH